MHQKVMAVALMTFVCVLLIACAGCTSIQEKPQVPTTQSPAITETRTTIATPVPTLPITSEVTAVSTLLPRDEMADRDGSSDHGSAFNVFFVKSQAEIINKTNDLVEAMAPGSMTVQAVYSPSVVYIKAEDLGFTIEKYYDMVLNFKTNTPEDETNRIAYLQFLSSAKSPANRIADAAEAESFGDYQNALAMATAAKVDLRNIKVDPDLPPTIPYNLLDVFLNEYIGRLRDKVSAIETKETTSRH